MQTFYFNEKLTKLPIEKWASNVAYDLITKENVNSGQILEQRIRKRVGVRIKTRATWQKFISKVKNQQFEKYPDEQISGMSI